MTIPARWLLVATMLAALAACGDDSAKELVASAKADLAQSRPGAAVVKLKQAAQKVPKAPEVRFLLGKALLDNEDAASASIELERAAELQHPADEVAPLLAKALLARREFKALVDRFSTSTLGSASAKADLNTTLAAAYASLGDTGRAEQALNTALGADPSHVPARIFQARVLAGRGDAAGAMQTVESVLAKAPQDHDALVLKGDLLEAQRDSAAAIAAYRQAVAVHKDSVAAHSAIASIHLRRSEYNEAKAQIGALKAHRPLHPQVRFLEARLAYQQRDFHGAWTLVEPLLKGGSDNPFVLELAGVVAYQVGATRQAETALTKALANRPSLVVARRQLVRLYQRAGNTDKALTTLAPLVAGDPAAEDLALAGSVRLAAGDVKTAQALLTRAAAREPNDVRYRTALAMTRLAGGDAATALAELERAAEADKTINADVLLLDQYAARREWKKAQAVLDRMEPKSSRRALVPSLRGKLFTMMGDPVAARRSFERAFELDPDYFPAVGALGAIDINEGKRDAAWARFQALLKRQPQSGPAMLALAQMAAADGKTDMAIALTERAVKAEPGKPTPRVLLADYLISLREPARALAVAEEAAAQAPENPEVLFALGRAQAANRDLHRAGATFRKAIALSPHSADGYVGLADVLVASKNPAEAAATLARALQVEPSHLPAQQRLVSLELLAGRFERALAVARTVQSQRPREAAGPLLEGDIEAARKNWPGAAALYRQALSRGGSGELATKLHASLRRVGSAEADRFASQWLADHPKDVDLRFHLAGLDLVENRLAEAEDGFRQVLALEPDHPLALNNLAWLMAQRGHPGALAHAERANALRPGDPALMDTLAGILARGGKLPKALELQRRAVTLAPDSAPVRLNLAKLLLQAGEKAAARDELQALGRLGDQFGGQKEVQQLLKGL